MNRLYTIPLLMLLLGAMLAAGCADNSAVSRRYAVEKKFHEAEKALQKAGIKPELVTPETRAEIRQLYAETADLGIAALDSIDQKRFPVEYRELQHLAFQASSQLARLLYFDFMYSEGITVLEHLLSTTDLQPQQVLTTRLNLGRSLQASGQWDSAQVIYKMALEGHYPPIDEAGDVLLTLFNLPAHIYRVEHQAGDSTAAAERLAWALGYYGDLVQNFPGTKLEAAAHGNLARLYDQTGQWQKEVDQLYHLLDSASTSHNAIRIKIADLYGTKLKQFSQAMDLYDELVAELDGSDSVFFPVVMQKMAAVKMEQGKYSEARQIVTDLKRGYRRYFATNPMSQYLVARSFELENNWSRAEVEYNYLIENYRGSDEALAAFLYVAEQLREAGRTAESERWYQDAAEYYQQVAAASPGTIIEAKALAYQADLLARREEWPQTAERLVHLFERFPRSEPGRRALLRAAGIYKHKLGDTGTADSLVDVFRASVADFTGAQEK